MLNIKNIFSSFLLILSVSFSLQAELATKAAERIDSTLTQSTDNIFLKPFNTVKARVIGVCEFPVLTTLDALNYSRKGATNELLGIISRDPAKKNVYKEKANENWEQLSKSLIATVTSPAAIISPDIVTHHYLKESASPNEVTPYGKLFSAKVMRVYPESIEDIQAIFLEAMKHNLTVSIAGSSMSQGKQILPSSDGNILIETKNLNQITIDPTNKMAIVGAGSTWADLQREANQHGLSVKVMQASNVFSIGGSISANCHGWDYKTGSLRNTIHEITLVSSDGTVHRITPQDEMFNYVMGGYGAMGVIVEAKIELTDNIMLAESGEEVGATDYIEYFYENVHENPFIDMHLYRLSLNSKEFFKTGVAVNYIRYDEKPVIANLIDEPKKGNDLEKIELHAIRRLPWMRNFAWSIEKRKALATNIKTRNELMRPPINPIFNPSEYDTEWLQEYFVSAEELPNFIAFLAKILQSNNVPVFNASVRFVKHDPDTILSYASKNDQFAVVLFFNQKLSSGEIEKTKRWVRQVNDYLIAHNGTYYLPYQPFATKHQFNQAYPRWEKAAEFKNTMDPSGIIASGFISDYFSEAEPALLEKTFVEQKSGMGAFINNIFMQLDDESFFSLLKSIQGRSYTDEEMYEILAYNIHKAKPNKFSLIKKQFTALKAIQADLSDQVKTLLPEDAQVNGYVEIGYPGRMIRPLKNKISLKGPVYVVADYESYIEAGFPRPYDHYIPLNDYAPMNIPDESVDLVCLYIGLHHIPLEKLDAFIASIERVLRPGGHFILMDHDAHNDQIRDLADAAHSIFNLGTGVSIEENMKELRNFQSIDYWSQAVASHGLTRNSKPALVREGDPTLNSLIRFDKPGMSVSGMDYTTRAQAKTYLTAPEWQNVHSAQEYADFVQENSSSKYPYFRSIANYWKVFKNSWNAARKHDSPWDVLTSDCTLMNFFIGTTMTIEYGVKGIVSAPFSLFPNSDQADEMKKVKAASAKEYAEFIEHTPFYCYPYHQDVKKYWSAYGQNCSWSTPFKSAKNFCRGVGMTLDYEIKQIISAPIEMVYGSETFAEDRFIDMTIYDPRDKALELDERINLISKNNEGVLKIRIPRYMPFCEILCKFADENIEIRDIAGQKTIQLDICHNQDSPVLPNTTLLYSVAIPTKPNTSYHFYEANIEKLSETLRYINDYDIDLIYIHDF